jgi:hypothetical protein
MPWTPRRAIARRLAARRAAFPEETSMRGKTPFAGRALSMLALLSLLAALPAWAQPQTLVSCTTAGQSTADTVSHGFYVQNYAGTSLSTVTLTYYAAIPGNYTIALRAVTDSFDGQFIASRVKSVDIESANIPTAVTFDFDGIGVPHGETLVFSQSVLGPAEESLVFDTGTAPCAATETKDFTPPTSTVTRNSVGVTITGAPSGACLPAGTTLCISDVQGDNRFQVIATYKTNEGGGLAGDGNAIDTTNIGITTGGVFWFFGEANPEMLVKVINGCSVNNFYWVFYAADTNVGFTVTVTDTLKSMTKTYSNPDLTPAAPVQDTAAFPCG